MEQIAVGFAITPALKRIKMCRGVCKTLLVILRAFPFIVIIFSRRWTLSGAYNFLPNILVKLGIYETVPQFLTSDVLAFVSLVLTSIWFGVLMIMVSAFSALKTAPKGQYEVAQIDRVRPWQPLYYVIVPHIKIVVGLLAVLGTVWTSNSFDLIYLITGDEPAGTTQTIPFYAYNTGWSTKLAGHSSVVIVLLFVLLMIICGTYLAVINKWEKEDNK